MRWPFAFETNLSGDEISDFVKYELQSMPDWKFESYSISGDGGNEFCYIAQTYASVTYQNEAMNKIARLKINAVLKGKSSKSVKDDSVDTVVQQEPAVEEQPTQDYSTNYYEPYVPDNSYSYEDSSYYDQSYDYYAPEEGYDNTTY